VPWPVLKDDDNRQHLTEIRLSLLDGGHGRVADATGSAFP